METFPLLGFSVQLSVDRRGSLAKTREGGRDSQYSGSPDTGCTPPTPPFHVTHTFVHEIPTPEPLLVGCGRVGKTSKSVLARILCGHAQRAVAQHTERETDRVRGPEGPDLAPESSAVCFRSHCRSIDLQYHEETFPLLGFSVQLSVDGRKEFGKNPRRRPWQSVFRFP